MLESGAIESLIKYYDLNPETNNLIQGPLIYDDLKTISTSFKPG
jgi:hypothetical protein